MPELEAWEKVIITGSNGDRFLESVHGPNFEGDNGTPHVLTCQHCHGGAADFTFETMDEAHAGMHADPSAPGQSGCTNCHDESFARSACDQCHEEAVTNTANSLHTTQRGYVLAIEARSGSDFDAENSPGFAARCAGCHTTCGQCHISRPNSVGGGFPRIGSYYSHRFRESPDMNEQCTACHGSRIGHDYKGEGEGNVPSVHRTGGMKCEDCHTKEEIHGDGTEYTHRYEVANMPRCEDCHQPAVSTDGSCSTCHPSGFPPDNPAEVPSDLINHAHHVDGAASDCTHCHGGTAPTTVPANMQCQVCHSQPYKNCTNCHNMTEGHEGYDIEPSVLQLKIARNPSEFREEYDVSLVRHIPVSPETFANWGLSLPEYTSEPTWVYTSPHNVIASTPQTTVPDGQSCAASCHGSPDGPDGFLLRETDLYEADGTTPLPDYDANIDYVIPSDFPSGK
ncbi:hypothetical protein GF314_05815 [bacterium]|nr:hypothetical protein [bacterium]